MVFFFLVCYTVRKYAEAFLNIRYAKRKGDMNGFCNVTGVLDDTLYPVAGNLTADYGADDDLVRRRCSGRTDR